jgi:hypothetical protein
MSFKQIRQNVLLERVGELVIWQSGDANYIYIDDGIISGPLLEALVKLAARAPYPDKKRFLERWVL